MTLLADRPVVNGKPVPYVARWTGEKPAERFCKYGVTPSGVGYQNESALDRDLHGVLWMREWNLPGAGEPEWAQVHSVRQRRCMTKRRCQVCATKLGDGPYHWLRPNNLIEATNEQPFCDNDPFVVTETPPVCERCAEEAAKYCPALRQGMQRFLVSDFQQVGWRGELAIPKDGVISRVKIARVLLEDPLRYFMIAKAVTVRMELTP